MTLSSSVCRNSWAVTGELTAAFGNNGDDEAEENMLGRNLNWVMMGDTATLISPVLYITAAQSCADDVLKEAVERKRERR